MDPRGTILHVYTTSGYVINHHIDLKYRQKPHFYPKYSPPTRPFTRPLLAPTRPFGLPIKSYSLFKSTDKEENKDNKLVNKKKK